MASDEKTLLKADGLMLEGKYAEAMALLRELITITPETTEFATEDFNMQKLLLFRIQRIYKTSGNGSPAPLEKLIKYYEIVARNHPGDSIQLSPQEAQICGLVLDWAAADRAGRQGLARRRNARKATGRGHRAFVGRQQDQVQTGRFLRQRILTCRKAKNS